MKWVEISGYDGYKISESGLVSGKRKQNLSTFTHKCGYVMVSIGYGVTRKNLYLHRLLANAFIPNPLGLPMVNHIDGDKQNNVISNLEWCDAYRNASHAFEIGKNKAVGENHHAVTLTDNDVDRIRSQFVKGSPLYGLRALARKYNVHMATISRIVNMRSRVQKTPATM